MRRLVAVIAFALLAAAAPVAAARADTLVQDPLLPDEVQDVTFDSAGNRWYINFINSTAGKVTPDGTLLARFDEPGNGSGGARVRDRLERVESAGGDVSRLRAHDRRPLQPSERALDRGRIDPALSSGRNATRVEAPLLP